MREQDWYHLSKEFLLQCGRDRPSPPGTFHILIGKFSYFVIRFLLNSSTVKSDIEIRKINDKKK